MTDKDKTPAGVCPCKTSSSGYVYRLHQPDCPNQDKTPAGERERPENMVTNVTMTIYDAEPVAPEAKPEPPKLSTRDLLELCLIVMNAKPQQGWDKWRNAVAAVEEYLRTRPVMGDGDYSCVQCGMGMLEPCEHWKNIPTEMEAEPGEFMSAEEFWLTWSSENWESFKKHIPNAWPVVAIKFAEAYHRAALDHERRGSEK